MTRDGGQGNGSGRRGPGREQRPGLRVLIIDNFDSFTHNLAQLIGGLGAEVVVRRNRCPTAELHALGPDRVVLSPGPGTPADAGCCLPFLRDVAGQVPVLGVCLGMQVIAAGHGAVVRRASLPVHGRASGIVHDGRGVLAGLPQGFAAARYHSLVVEESTLPPALIPTARTADGLLMGLRHARLPVEGIQFHPESVLTPLGERIVANFLGLPPGGRAVSARARPLTPRSWG